MNVGHVLCEWAAWVAAEREGRLDYPSVSAFYRMTGGGPPNPMISAEQATAVSQVMAKLSRRKPMFHDILERHYILRQNISKIARERKESRHVVTQSMLAAETAVEILLTGLEDY